MKKHMQFSVIFLFAIFIVQDGFAQNKSTLSSAQNLLKRVLPKQYQQIDLGLLPPSKKDSFEISSKGNRVLLKGNSTIALASALNWYLKYTCNANISWNDSQMQLPEQLPLPKTTIAKAIQPDYRVMFNYCTFSYSMVWWDWNRWEKELDFLAMNGINMPLTVVGLEAVWYNSLLKIGYTDLEARQFLVGPAFMAWQWMTNIESFGGPLPKSWIDSHIILGKQIMDRELELGMKPIQQGFSGYVPRSFKTKFPDAKIAKTKDWCNFEGCAQLDPLDPLFAKFGKIFLEEQAKLFGNHGFYAADPFHESAAPSTDSLYLDNVGKTIHNLMAANDKDGIWVMQAWSINKKIVTAVEKSKLLILDLNGLKYKSNQNFWGYPFVVGNLHNFGNRINLHGDIALLASNQFASIHEKLPNAVGSGLFMEGTMQNPLYYDLAFEMPFHSTAINLDSWLNSYATRRYGNESKAGKEAIQILAAAAYKKGTNGVENSSMIAARPAIDPKKSGPNAGFKIPYSQRDLIKVVDLLLSDATLYKSEGYRYDIVDIQRQILSNLAQAIDAKISTAYKAKNSQEFELHTQRFLTLLKDADRLTKTRPLLNFNKWVGDAQSWGTTPEEKNLYDYNASMLLTQWGPEGNRDAVIFDYSWREWGGLIGNYYLPRWQKFFAFLKKNLDENVVYSEEKLKNVHGREALRANPFYDELANWELQWIHTPKTPEKLISGQELMTVKEIRDTYKPLYDLYL
ncbi:alpha-N-acetylglucosaminidase [Pedobacter sp. MW01-1-1]|uniref:alpha-N-acetylglucosaminidase n=1 Tax=Pedobacter sp. MW01-1-1 TaxID=3383027 RepID=UPI003FEF5D51